MLLVRKLCYHSEVFTIHPQFVFAQIHIIVPRNTISTRINNYRSKECFIFKWIKYFSMQQLITVVDFFYAIIKLHQQSLTF